MSGLGLGLGFRVRVRVRFRFRFRCPLGKCPSGMSPSGTCPRSISMVDPSRDVEYAFLPLAFLYLFL